MEISIIGNLTHDPEAHQAQNGGSNYVRFSVAVDVSNYRNNNGNEVPGKSNTEYFDFTVWGHLADHVVQSLHKGDRVVVHGRVQKQTYTKQDGTTGSKLDVRVEDVGVSLKWGVSTFVKSEYNTPTRNTVVADNSNTGIVDNSNAAVVVDNSAPAVVVDTGLNIGDGLGFDDEPF